MAGLPKKYARMGFAKGWKEYRKTKAGKNKRTPMRASTSYKRTRRSYKMARKKTYRKSKGILGELNRPILGSIGVVAYESLVSPMIPLQGVAKDLLELGFGAWASKKRGILGATGKTLVTINAYQIMSGLISKPLQGLIGQQPTAAYNYGGVY